MTITLVIVLLATAIALILVEIFLVPGVGVPGIIGLALLAITLYVAYTIDNTTGHITLGVTTLVSAGLMLLAFRAKTWTRLSIQEEIKSKVTFNTASLQVGQEGKTLTRLNPIGNVMFDELQFEARSKGEFIDDHTLVEIVNIEGNKITVIPKTQTS